MEVEQLESVLTRLGLVYNDFSGDLSFGCGERVEHVINVRSWEKLSS